MKGLFSFLESHLEHLALVACLLAVAGLAANFEPASGAAVVLFCTLALYYLASGVLVLLDKSGVERVMRITWFLGLWGLSLLVIGVMARVLFWESARMALMAGTATAIGMLAFSLLNRMGLKAELREAYDRENRGLLRRLWIGIALGAAVFFTPDRALYGQLGPYRDDPEYVQRLMEHLAEPDDPEAEAKWRAIHEQKQTERRTKALRPETPTP